MPALRATACAKVAIEKRAAFRDWDYWGKPLPNLGEVDARLLVVGLAPAAHGGNRTGRTFTGDRSADFLFRAMYDAGFASQPTSTHRDDGLRLIDATVTNLARARRRRTSRRRANSPAAPRSSTRRCRRCPACA